MPAASPQELQAEIVNSRTLNLTWQLPLPEHRNGIIRRYTVIVEEMETGSINLYVTDELHIIIDELHPFYTYNCSVAAQTIGLGPFSTEVVIRMPEDGKYKVYFK